MSYTTSIRIVLDLGVREIPLRSLSQLSSLPKKIGRKNVWKNVCLGQKMLLGHASDHNRRPTKDDALMVHGQCFVNIWLSCLSWTALDESLPRWRYCFNWGKWRPRWRWWWGRNKSQGGSTAGGAFPETDSTYFEFARVLLEALSLF